METGINGTKKSCLTCVIKSDLFKVLSDEELELIEKSRRETKFKPGELIMKQGVPSNHVIFVTKGLVKLYLEGIENKNMILNIIKPTQYISGPELYYNSVNVYSAMALTDVECCYVDTAVFKQLVWNNRKYSEAFISEFCRRSIRTLHVMVSLTQKKMHGRVAEGILLLSKVFESDTFDMLLTKKEFGDLTSMTRESAIRILHQFKEDGIINLDGNYLEIKDKEKLVSISNKG